MIVIRIYPKLRTPVSVLKIYPNLRTLVSMGRWFKQKLPEKAFVANLGL